MLSCFKVYDIRGKLGIELNKDIAYRIGRAYSYLFKPDSVVIGGDIRLSTKGLKQALACGLNDGGTNVLDIGMSGTEEIYFATSHLGVDGGIEVTASHNPKDYNGMKLILKNSYPISIDTGLLDIQNITERKSFGPSAVEKGNIRLVNILPAYINHLFKFINLHLFRKPIKLVINSGNSTASHVIDMIETYFQSYETPISFIKIYHQNDNYFPHDFINNLSLKYRTEIKNIIKSIKADMGIIFDTDFDRCLLFDEKGNFIDGYYIVGLLSEIFLQKYPNNKVIHDPRLIWNTQEIVINSGGIPVMCKTGHSFIKEKMRKENAIYGGEISDHHYFRDFFYCDSGMIPWLLIAELISSGNKPLSQFLNKRIQCYPISGEINITSQNTNFLISEIKNTYIKKANDINTIDGLSLSFRNWRFNIRSSNTESVIRLNVESRGDLSLVEEKTNEILNIIDKNS